MLVVLCDFGSLQIQTSPRCRCSPLSGVILLFLLLFSGLNQMTLFYLLRSFTVQFVCARARVWTVS